MPPRGAKIAILGDLHYEVEEDETFRLARAGLLARRPSAIFQLGDQGGYTHCGTRRSFVEGFEFLRGFGVPFCSLIGNHDLEGSEYRSDAEAIAAWRQVFGRRRPFRAVDLGAALGIVLSSTRFRANPACHHEVHIDDRQFAWLEATLASQRKRPTFVFSHAPIMGSGLRVLADLHLKCPNAWLNHTDRPERFIRLLRRHPQIKLWFSAHNHLGQNYPDSITRVGECAFVHTGVIGPVSRDGARHSRFVEYDRGGCQVSTFDHATGELIPNLRREYASERWEEWTSAPAEDGPEHFAPPAFPAREDRWRIERSVFALHRGMLIEYDHDLEAPLGVVIDGLRDERIIVENGSLQVRAESRTIELPRNEQGRFYRVYAPNPWLPLRLSA